jgi:methylated-DNA-[protein]-cysteine S-methyltransferase
MNYFTTVESPIGTLLLLSNGDYLTGLYTMPAAANEKLWHGALYHAELPLFVLAEEQLKQYFAGDRHDFSIPLKPTGTEFQQAVWAELRRIPFGEHISYGELARRLGNPSASRAVGLANGRNPLSIIVPCHRVIGQNGSLTGYAGGIERKRFLLEMEAQKSQLRISAAQTA